MSSLLACVLAEKSCVEAFVSALQEEEEALSQGRFAELAAGAEGKARLLADLAEADRAREATQAQLGWPPGRAGADAAAAASDSLGAAWADLLACAARASELSRRVASQVHTHLDFTSNALAYLQDRNQPLYGRDGARVLGPASSSRIAAG